MLKSIIFVLLIISLVLCGCSDTVEEETIFSLSKEQQEHYANVIEEELNSFYWYYDDSKLEYYETTIPNDLDLFKATKETGFDMSNYVGRTAVCYTAQLQHFNTETAGTAYFYFIKDNLVGLCYSPLANPNKFVELNTRNVFTHSANIEKIESDEYYSLNYNQSSINVLANGFCSENRRENETFVIDKTDTALNIYRYRSNGMRRYKVINSSQLKGLKPISAAFDNNGGIAVICGNIISGYEELETEKMFSERVIFFDKNFNRLSMDLELNSGSYSCVSFYDDKLVLINDKNTELYGFNNGNYIKESSFYTNIQAVDFKQTDLDNNGISECVITDNKDIYVFRIDNNKMNCIWRTNVSREYYYGYIYTADLNDDGAQEIYICDNTGTAVRYVLGENGIIAKNSDIVYGQRIYAGDFNNDGKYDYILFDGEKGTICIRE